MTATEEMRAAVSDWNRDDCTSWCTETQHNSDPACWGEEGKHEVFLSMEDGFPLEAVEPYDPVWLRQYQGDPPRVAIYAYRGRPGYREVVYLHLYRPSDNEHLDLDASVHLTGQEAVQLAHYLLRVATTVDPALAEEGNRLT